MFEDDKDHWRLMFKGICVWSYFRNSYYEAPTLAYKPRVDFSFASFLGLFYFLTLRFRKGKSNVVFTTSRDYLNQFVHHHFSASNNIILFRRTEQLKGNVFFIEVIWYLFRRFSYLFNLKERDLLWKQVNLIKYSSDNKKIANQVVGDFYYNHFLRMFLRGKSVYFSNCVIPKIEKYMDLHNSTEIQHGVISYDHIDYANIPAGCLKVKLLVWNRAWAEKVKVEVNYCGELCWSDFSELSYDSNVAKVWDRLIYSTVSSSFSELVASSLNMKDKYVIQKHPRDFFPYPREASFGVGVNPFTAHKIYIHDSTLIAMLLFNKCYFHYVSLPNETKQDIQERLYRRYGAVYGQDYLICRELI